MPESIVRAAWHQGAALRVGTLSGDLQPSRGLDFSTDLAALAYKCRQNDCNHDGGMVLIEHPYQAPH